MIAPLLRIPFISISPRKIVHYTRTLHNIRRKKKSNVYSQEMSQADKDNRAARMVKARLKDSIYMLCDTARKKKVFDAKRNRHFTFKVAFMTLTLPGEQLHTDKEIHYNVFRPFMRRLKRMLPSLLYVWRAETQENGHLHYHLIVNEFIHYRDIRKWWNYYCLRAGYTKHADPNSTDIHSLRKVRDEAAYISKYLTKVEDEKKKKEKERDGEKESEKDRRDVDMKVWDCSMELKKAKRVVIEMPTQQLYDECRVIAEKGARVKHYEYCSVQYFNPIMLKAGTLLHDMYQQLIRKVLDAIPPPNTLTFSV
jgi:hypothetical protein